MFLRLLFLLTFIPFIEIYFLIGLGDSIGWSNTLLVILATGVLGAWLLKKQGHSILNEIQSSTSQAQLPSDAIAKGFFTFVGGLLLLTPGILTDAIGLSLIFPLTQVMWKKYFMKQWKSGVAKGNIRFYGNFGQGPQRPEHDPFAHHQKRQDRFDNEVIDIKASTSETLEKEEE